MRLRFCSALRKNLAFCKFVLTYSLSSCLDIFFIKPSYALLILILGLIEGFSSVIHLSFFLVIIISGVICSCCNDLEIILPGLGFNDLTSSAAAIYFLLSFSNSEVKASKLTVDGLISSSSLLIIISAKS